MDSITEERDWDGDQDVYHENAFDQHPNLLAMVTVEQWVASDADIIRAIQRLTEVLLHRKGQNNT